MTVSGEMLANLLPVLFVEPLQKTSCDQRDIVKTLTQRWDLNLDRADTEVEILAQETFVKQRDSVAVRG